MALVVSVPQAAALLLPNICISDIYAIWAFRKIWDKSYLAIMIPGAIIGVVVGATSFKYLDPAFIKLIIASIAVIFSSIKFIDYLREKISSPPPRRH